MKRVVIFLVLISGFTSYSLDLLTVYDASYFWSQSRSNSIAGISINPSFGGLGERDLNLRFNHFNGIADGMSISSGIFSAKINDDLSVHAGLESYSKPSFDVYDETGEFIQNLDVSANIKGDIGLAYKLRPGLLIGFQYNHFINNVVGDEGVIDKEILSLVSFGFNLSFREFLIGFTLRDFKLFESLKYEGEYPELSSLDFSVSRSFFKNNLNTSLIFSNANGRTSGYKAALALEYRLRYFYLRTAYLYTSQYLSMPFKFGFGIKFRDIDLDYTFSPGEFQGSHYISLGYGYDLPEKRQRRKRPVNDADRILVAVLDFEKRDVGEAEAIVITDYLRSEMINSGYFKVLERSAIDSILQELNFQQSGCTDASCAVEVGKILAVRKMIVGRLSKVNGKYYITARVVDVETSEIESSESIEAAETLDGLKKNLGALVDRIVDNLR